MLKFVGLLIAIPLTLFKFLFKPKNTVLAFYVCTEKEVGKVLPKYLFKTKEDAAACVEYWAHENKQLEIVYISSTTIYDNVSWSTCSNYNKDFVMSDSKYYINCGIQV